jgi:hypothetical protein
MPLRTSDFQGVIQSVQASWLIRGDPFLKTDGADGFGDLNGAMPNSGARQFLSNWQRSFWLCIIRE